MSSVKQPVGWSVSQLSVSQLASHVSRSVSQSVKQTVCLSVGHPALTQSVSSQSVSQLAGRRSVDQPASRSVRPLVSHVSQSVKQVVRRQSTNRRQQTS